MSSWFHKLFSTLTLSFSVSQVQSIGDLFMRMYEDNKTQKKRKNCVFVFNECRNEQEKKAAAAAKKINKFNAHVKNYTRLTRKKNPMFKGSLSRCVSCCCMQFNNHLKILHRTSLLCFKFQWCETRSNLIKRKEEKNR